MLQQARRNHDETRGAARPRSAIMTSRTAARNRAGAGEINRPTTIPSSAVAPASSGSPSASAAASSVARICVQMRLRVGRRDQNAGNRPGPAPHRGPTENGAGAFEAKLLGEDQPAVAPVPPTVAQSASAAASPIAIRPKVTASTRRSDASAARSTSRRRARRAPWKRIVSCGSHSRRAPAPTAARDSIRVVSLSVRYVLLRRAGW